MLKENARVIAVNNDLAIVETHRKVACQSCAVNKGCGTGVIARVIGGKRFHLEVLNPIKAEVGDEVIVGIEDNILVASSFIVYTIPLILMLAGGILGEVAARAVGLGASEGLVILFSAMGFSGGLMGINRFTRRMASNAKYRPVILSRGGERISFASRDVSGSLR